MIRHYVDGIQKIAKQPGDGSKRELQGLAEKTSAAYQFNLENVEVLAARMMKRFV